MCELCPDTAALFPVGAVVAELYGAGAPGGLSQDEMASVRHCSESRLREFAAGRSCARRALREFGIEGFALLPGEDRVPRWPAGFAGSITHTEGYSAAVLMRQGVVGSVGLDSEQVSAVHENLWPRICCAQELAQLRELAPERRALRAALTFAAKEAFYKSQYPLTRQWLGFADVAIEIAADFERTGAFTAVPQRRLLLEVGPHPRGRFRCHGTLVSAGIALPVPPEE